MVIGRRELGAILLGVAAIVFYLVLLSTTPSGAQTGGSGPSAGTSATGDNPDNPSSPPNRVTISASSCTVAQTGASITLADGDGTEARFVDGQGVEISATASQITIEVVNSGDFLNDVAEFPNAGDTSFDTDGDYTVVTSTGITCAGGGTNRTTNQNQYNTQNQVTTGRTTTPRTTSVTSQKPETTVINVPNKPLPPSGGLAVYGVIAGSVLAGAGLLTLGLGIRRGPQG